MMKFVVFALFVAGSKDLFHTTPLRFTDRMSVSPQTECRLRVLCTRLSPQRTGVASPPSPLC